LIDGFFVIDACEMPPQLHSGIQIPFLGRINDANLGRSLIPYPQGELIDRRAVK
jgi:hypothetical protein